MPLEHNHTEGFGALERVSPMHSAGHSQLLRRALDGFVIRVGRAAEQPSPAAIAKRQIVPGTPTLRTNRSTRMRSKPVAALDDSYSEWQFGTLRYRSDSPERVGHSNMPALSAGVSSAGATANISPAASP
jgi:hypothetical protein